MRRNRLLDAGWLTNLPRFQGARPDHVRVESSSCCFPRELVSFVRPRELMSSDPRHVTRSPPIRKRIWVGRYNNGSYPMMAKPMKTLELHYPMIQILIIPDISYSYTCIPFLLTSPFNFGLGPQLLCRLRSMLACLGRRLQKQPKKIKMENKNCQDLMRPSIQTSWDNSVGWESSSWNVDAGFF